MVKILSARVVLPGFLLALAWLTTGCGSSVHPGSGGTSSTTSILIVADSSSIGAGASSQLHAIESLSLFETTDVTDSVTWSTSNSAVAKVSTSGMLTGLAAGNVTISAKLNTASGSLAISVGAPVTVSLSVSPQTANLAVAATHPYKATALYSDQSTHDVSSSVTWTATPASVATITTAGVVTAVAVGNFTVTASDGALSASALGVVTAPALVSIAVTAASAAPARGSTDQFTAIGTYTDKTTADLTKSVVWSSSNAAVLSINAVGLGSAVSGDVNTTVTISAASGAIAGSIAVVVTPGKFLQSLQVKPTSSRIADGSAEQHQALALYTDGTQQDVTSEVVWSVSSSAGSSSPAHLAPNSARNPTRNPAQTQQASTRTGGFSNASSAGDAAVVSVNQSGMDTAMSPGDATIQASLGSISTQSDVLVTQAKIVSLAISSPDNVFKIGAEQQLMLTGTFSDGSQQDLSLIANWTSTNTAIATIDSTGWATGVKAGSVQFGASFGGLKATSSSFLVSAANLVSTVISVPYPVVPVGVSEQLSVIGTYADGSTQDLTQQTVWTAANPAIFQVGSTGLAYALAAGDGQIEAAVLGKTAVADIAALAVTLQSIQILPVNGKLALGTTLDFTALGHFSDGAQVDISAPALWTSENPAVLTIDGQGRAESASPGATKVKASLLGVTAESTVVSVSKATLVHLSITPQTAQIAALTRAQLQATGFFTDGSFEDVTPDVNWSSSNPAVAQVDSAGVAYGIAPGTVDVTATLMGESVASRLTVTGAILTAVALSPGNVELPAGVTRPFKLLGSFSDGSTQDLSADAIWSAPDPSIVTVNGKGMVIGISPGYGSISAQRGFFSATTEVNVTDVKLTSIALTPAANTIRRGSQQQLTATGTFSDGFQQNLYLNAIFSSGDTGIAVPSATGLISGVGVGSTQITASFEGKTASTTSFKVLSDQLTSIAISPSQPMVDSGGTTQLTATGTYADQGTGDVSSVVSWRSSNALLLTVDETGLAVAAAGVTKVTAVTVAAEWESTSTSVVVLIEPSGTAAPTPTLTRIDVTPTSAKLAAGTMEQLHATGAYSDGSSQDLTGAVQWTSGNPQAATVISTAKTAGTGAGLVTAVHPGTAIISASLAGQTVPGQTIPTQIVTGKSTVLVSAASLLSVAVSPGSSSLAIGVKQPVTLTGSFSDGGLEDLTAQAKWSSLVPSVATVAPGAVSGLPPGQAGELITAIATGSTEITATVLGKTATATELVTPAKLLALAITPSTASFAVGTRQQFEVAGIYSDGTVQALTSSVAFLSSDRSVMSIAAGGLANGLAAGSTTIAAAFGGLTASTNTLTVTPAILTSLAIAPLTDTLANGTSVQFAATGTFSDQTVQDLSSQVVWATSNPAVLTVGSNGLAGANSVGTATVSALLNDAQGQPVQMQSGAVQVTAAVLAGLAVTPATATVAKGSSRQFTATGNFTDGSVQDLTPAVIWTSSNARTASISSSGVATGMAPGNASVTAAYSGPSASGAGAGSATTTSTAALQVTAATLTSLSFAPNPFMLAAGTAAQVTVTGHFSDGTTQDLTAGTFFESSNSSAAIVSSTGLIKSVAPGSSVITAMVQGLSGTFTVTVSNPTLSSIDIVPASPAALAKGATLQLHATGLSSDGSTQTLNSGLSWTSSNASIVTVDSSGLARGVGVGSAFISVAYQGKTAQTAPFPVTAALATSISVTPINGTLTTGSSRQYRAQAIYTDGSTADVSASVAWSSSDTEVATIVAGGLATAIAPGGANLVAVLSINSAAASGSISGYTGLTVTAAPITLLSISVQPTSSRVAAGTTEQLTATGRYSDGSSRNLTGSVLWVSLNAQIASVTQGGLVAGLTPGTASIQAAVASAALAGPAMLTSQAQVVVSSATLTSLAISPSGLTLAIGEAQQFTLTGSFSDGSQQNLTAGTGTAWTSTTPTVASVSSVGLVTGIVTGPGDILASYQGQTATASVEITGAALRSLAMTPPAAAFAKGTTQQFHAIASYSDGSQHDLTASATFSTSDAGIVIVGNSGDASGAAAGLATGVNVGSAEITALVGGFSAQTTSVTVSGATLVSIAITPTNFSFADGASEQFTAIGSFSDGTTEDLTGQVTWISSNPAVLTINAVGLASGAMAGSATVMATFNGISMTSGAIEVSTATLTGLSLTPTAVNLAKGTTQQFTATGSYSDGSQQDLSRAVNWASSDPAVVSIDANGLATASGTGSAQITASYQARTAMTTSFTVTAATLISIAFNPPAPSLAAGASSQVMVIGTFSDGTTQDLTSSAAFTSSNPAAVTISSTGVLSGVAPGSSKIAVQVDGTSDSFTVTVTNVVLTSIAIKPANPSAVAKGATEQFSAAATYSDGTMQSLSSSTPGSPSSSQSVSWNTSGPDIAQISSTGLLTGDAPGSVTVTASYQGFTAVTPAFQITAAQVASVAVTPLSASIVTGGNQQFAATATNTDSTTTDVSSIANWNSTNPAFAAVNSSGLATGVAAGNTTIAATVPAATGSVSGFATLTVTAPPPALTAISITPTSSHLAQGTTQQFSATGIYSDSRSGGRASGLGLKSSKAAAGGRLKAVGLYSDGSHLDLTSLVTWTSSDSNLLTVSPLGLARAISPGTAMVGAQLGTILSQATVVVTAATLTSVAISPSGSSFAEGATQQFTLTGTFSDNSTQDITSAAIWSSLAPLVATVSATGLALGVTPGTAEISAVYGGQSASTSIQITAATLTSVSITPATTSFAKGTSQQFHVSGSYSDATTGDLTGLATFSSSDSTVVSVAASGLALGVGAGTAQITATAGGLTASPSAVTITPAMLASIVISPHSVSFADGTTQQFTALGTFSDGSSQDLSLQVVWTSSSPQLLTINSAGLASAAALGNVQVWASLDGITAYSGTVQVTAAMLTGIAIAPLSTQIAKGTQQQFSATGQFTDGTAQSLSSSVTWISSNPAVVSIDANGLATGTGIGTAQITALFQGQTASTSSFTVTAATLVSIAFSPASASIAAGTQSQVSVIGTFSDGTTQDLTSSATFSSSNPASVTVNAAGVVSGVAAGVSTVAVSVNGVSSSFSVTVTSATLISIAITPLTPAPFSQGTNEQFTATGTYSDGSTQNLASLGSGTTTVTWSSANPAVATVNGNGLAIGTGPGTDQLTVSYQGKSATSSSFLVTPPAVASITVTPGTASITIGLTQQFTAIATYTDNSTTNVSSSAIWTPGLPAVATVNSNGLASAVSVGTTTIAAAFSGLSGTAALAVTALPAVTLSSVVVNPSSASVAKGNTQQFSAMGQYSDGSTQNLTMLAAWQSSAPSVATVDMNGLATSVSGGNTQIWAAYQGVSSVAALTVSAATLVSLAITPATVSLANGTAQQYKALGTLTDGSTQDLTASVTWTSSNPSAATISSAGFASTHGTGTTTVGAQAGAQMASATLTVTAATPVSVQLSPASIALPAGGSQQMLATATFTDGSSQNVTSSVIYTSANPTLASVNASGDVTAVAAGNTTITASLGSITASVPATISSAVLTAINITPANITLAAGVSQQLTATGAFSDGSTQNLTNSVTWSTSNSHFASVSTTGNVLAASAGTVTVTAAGGTGNAITASISVTTTSAVITSLTVSPGSATLAAGQTQQFAAISTLSDGSQQTITSSVHWSVSDPTKGTVSNSSGSYGLLTTNAAGSFQVTATLNGVSGSSPVTVSAASLTSIAATPNPLSLPSGTTQALAVTGTYTDGSTANLTSSATWTSASASTATVSAAGLLSGNSVGSTSVTATVQGLSATDTITVTSPVLQSIAITPASETLALGLHAQLTAIGTYLGGGTADITTQVQWGSSAPTVLTVSGSGSISTLTSGSANVTATLNSVTQQISVTVTAAVLQSIAVQAAQPTFALGLSVQLTAIGTYSDNSTQVLTSSVTWSSGTPSVGVVSSSGLATGVTTGSFHAQARLSGITGSLALTVTSAALQTIVVTPANSVVVYLPGVTAQFTATGHYSDGSTADLTLSVHWSVSGVVAGSISQAGVFSPLGLGAGTATAVSGSVTGSTGFIIAAV